MKLIAILIASTILLLSGCASNPDAVGQAMSGILSGIGTGLSGL